VQALLKGRQEQTVTVLGIENLSTLPATVLPGIELQLRAEFQKLGLLRAENGDVGIRGRLSRDENERLLLELALTNRAGRPIAGLPDRYLVPQHPEAALGPPGSVVLDDDNQTVLAEVEVPKAVLPVRFSEKSAVAVAYGATGRLEPGWGSERLERPSFVLTPEGGVKLSADSEQTVFVRVEQAIRPIFRGEHGGPAVDLRLGDTYELQIVNAAPRAVAATVLIDGLNTFAFSRKLGIAHRDHWVLYPDQVLLLSGWYTGEPESESAPAKAGLFTRVGSFRITPFEQSKRAQLGLGPDRVGAITIVFSDTRPLQPKVPTEVAIRDRRGNRRRLTVLADQEATTRQLGTGEGRVVRQRQGAQGNLVADRPLGIVTIRYSRPDK
jgi:hypothetical protein